VLDAALVDDDAAGKEAWVRIGCGTCALDAALADDDAAPPPAPTGTPPALPFRDMSVTW